MLTKLIKNFAQAFYSPKSLYREISTTGQSNSWIFVLLYCLIYVFGSLWLYFKGFTPFVSPWIKLSEEYYYLVQSFYIIPLIFLMWILGTGVIHLVSKHMGGKGRFDVLLKMTGYSLWVPWYPLIIVDVIHSTPEWLYNSVLGTCIILILIGTSVATVIEEKVNFLKATTATIIGFISIGLITFTYIR